MLEEFLYLHCIELAQVYLYADDATKTVAEFTRVIIAIADLTGRCSVLMLT